MAYLVDVAQTVGTAAAGPFACNMPAHQQYDLLVAVITVDTGTVTPSGSTWLVPPNKPNNPVTSGTITYIFHLIAGATPETMTLTTGDAYTVGIYCFRYADITTPFDGGTPKHAAVAGATSTPVSESVTTQTADALILYFIMQEGTTPQVLSDPGVMSFDSFDSTGTTATTSSHQSLAWYIQRATGATPTPGWSSNISGVYVRATLAIRNKSGGALPAYIDDSSAPATRLTCGHHIATLNSISFSASGSFAITANVNSKSLTQAAAVNGADFGINPYANALYRTAAVVAIGALGGIELVLTGGRDLTNGLICGSFIAGTPKMGTFGIGTLEQGGVVVRMASAATYWNAYQVAGKNSKPTTEQRVVFAIKAGYNGSQYGGAGSGGNANQAAITHVQFLQNCPLLASAVYMSELHQVFAQIIAGGDANNPVDTDGVADVGRSFRLPIIQKVGSAGLLSFAPIQIGGGDAVNFQIDAGSLQFPRRASATLREVQFHGPDNSLGISYAGKSGDVIKHKNSLISSPTPFYWQIHANATNAATWDFTGLSIIGGNVTLRNVMTFNAMNFTGCPTLDFTGCTVTNSKISQVPSGNDSATMTSATLTGCTIDVTGVAAGGRWCSL